MLTHDFSEIYGLADRTGVEIYGF
ncbi:hypothetical protein BN2475_190009 [Paraburkholderia ribeironis]|uniref:Uncharacterized protein n=1 Tax=Paraburkholderia ribeironis TaxID=1247936 RepID=A0A1N7RV72_9BURK|nr:hypothetical protein BN2475_190009 [Paraburkholderia ribeironis]